MSEDKLGASDGDKVLTPGKPWGTTGFGMPDGKTAAADLRSGASLDYGKTFSRMNIKDKTKCSAHYMMTQVGGTAFTKGMTATKTQELEFGVKKWWSTLEAPVIPTAATDPATPKAGAAMLSVGAAILASSLTLF